jgi:hypothetical protein
VVEASLHETSDPKDPFDPKHHVLARLGVLDQVEWEPTGAVYEVRGGPIGQPFVLPDGFARARRALLERFPSARAGIGSVLGEMERFSTALGTLSKGREALSNPLEGLSALARLSSLMTGWRLPYTAIQTGRDSRHARSRPRQRRYRSHLPVHRATASRVAGDTRRNRPPGRAIAMKKLTLS